MELSPFWAHVSMKQPANSAFKCKQITQLSSSPPEEKLHPPVEFRNVPFACTTYCTLHRKSILGAVRLNTRTVEHFRITGTKRRHIYISEWYLHEKVRRSVGVSRSLSAGRPQGHVGRLQVTRRGEGLAGDRVRGRLSGAHVVVEVAVGRQLRPVAVHHLWRNGSLQQKEWISSFPQCHKHHEISTAPSYETSLVDLQDNISLFFSCFFIHCLVETLLATENYPKVILHQIFRSKRNWCAKQTTENQKPKLHLPFKFQPCGNGQKAVQNWNISDNTSGQFQTFPSSSATGWKSATKGIDLFIPALSYTLHHYIVRYQRHRVRRHQSRWPARRYFVIFFFLVCLLSCWNFACNRKLPQSNPPPDISKQTQLVRETNDWKSETKTAPPFKFQLRGNGKEKNAKLKHFWESSRPIPDVPTVVSATKTRKLRWDDNYSLDGDPKPDLTFEIWGSFSDYNLRYL